MLKRSWMIYGAYGFTGRLIAEEAVRQGHRPLLAGRSAEKLAPMAEELGLEWIALDLEDHNRLTAALREVDLVAHIAGPYVITCAPMLRACLEAGTDYIDITGELPALRHIFAAADEARERGIMVVTGCGFDVVPTDCLAVHTAAKVRNPTLLEIAIESNTVPSIGTLLSALMQLAGGNWVRRNGVMRPLQLGRGTTRMRFPDGMRTAMPAPVGDLETAWHSTGIGDITTYFVLPRILPPLLVLTGPLLRALLRSPFVMRLIRRAAQRFASGPGKAHQQQGRGLALVRVHNAQGMQAEMWMETMEPYRFTAVSAVLAVERLFEQRRAGVFTPAQAFGPDFTMEIPGSVRTPVNARA